MIIGITSTTIITFLFKYVFKSKSDKIIEGNMKQTANEIFKRLAEIDYLKQIIYDNLNHYGKKYIERDHMKSYTLPTFIVSDIREMEATILGKSRSLTQFLKIFPYITYEQRNAVVNYSITSCSFLYSGKLRSDNGIIINKNILLSHMYFAKQIIESFESLSDKTFTDKWSKEFKKFGGINHISKPKLGTGVYINPYDVDSLL